MSVKRFNHDHGGRTSWMYECSDGDYVLNADYESLERQLAEVRGELSSATSKAIGAAMACELCKDDLERVTAERDSLEQRFADGVIALITTEQAAMCRLYEKHSYGINKVCNRLKLFVADLLKKPHGGEK